MILIKFIGVNNSSIKVSMFTFCIAPIKQLGFEIKRYLKASRDFLSFGDIRAFSREDKLIGYSRDSFLRVCSFILSSN